MKNASLRKARNPYNAALAPYSVWSLVFVVVPLAFIAYYAFTDNAFHFTTEHIVRFFTAKSTMARRTAPHWRCAPMC